jgi:hypothetical protein
LPCCFTRYYETEYAAAHDEKAAQKAAIHKTLVDAMLAFPQVDAVELWTAIHSAHLQRKSGIADITVVEAVTSAENSWKKSSGHAFEEMILSATTAALQGSGICLHLQRDVTTLLKRGEVANSKKDISQIEQWLKSSSFDLFATIESDAGKFIFGCVQTKTSIRDRVTRDREPSLSAMNRNFWSIAIVLDGAFLAQKKFIDMVNGSGSGFEENGWHGMYVFSIANPAGRIYRLTTGLSCLVEHAKIAARFWHEKRQWILPRWSPETADDY